MRSYWVFGIVAVAFTLAGCGDDETTSPGDGVTPTVQARFEVSPASGTIITDFTFNAGASSTSSGSLEFRWDWEGDGIWDTGWSTSATEAHRYSNYGGTQLDTVEVTLEARSGASNDTTTGEVIIDTRHGLVLETFPVHISTPSALGSDDTHLWMADWGVPGTRRIYKIETTSGDTLYSILSPDSWPCGVAWDGTNVCVTGNLMLRKLDPLTGAVLVEFAVIYAETPGGLAWDGEKFYHGSAGDESGADGYIHQYSAEGVHLASFEAPRGSLHMEGLAFDGTNLWVALRHSDSLYVLDPDDGSIIRTTCVNGRSGDLAVLGDFVWTLLGDTVLVRVVP